VQLFFVLSGFLITDILLRMKEKLKGKEFFSKFYGRRFLRIFPLYYFYLLLVTGIMLLLPALKINPLSSELGGRFWKQIGYAVFYVYDFFHASAAFEGTRFFTHLWSLSVEEQFYILWPLLIFLTPRQRFKGLCLAAIGLAPLLRLIISLIYRNHLFPFLLNDPQLAVSVLPFSQVDAFAMGAYLSRFEIPRPRLQLLVMMVIVPALGLAGDYIASGEVRLATLGYALPLAGTFKEVWGYSLLSYLFALTIYCVARLNLFRRVLENGILRYLGKISYGLYVYHYGIIAVVTALSRKYDLDYNVRSPQTFFLSLGGTILVASLSFYLLERPILNLKDRLFPVRTSP
jgi:peptidoglycan/LPS O-acetylase OafA/YrhL